MLRPLVLCLLLTALAASPPAAAERAFAGEVWVRVDTGRQLAEVMRGNDLVVRFPGISIGRGGAATVHLQGDHTTPLGDYRIQRISRQSRFHLFLELDYPRLPDLHEANRKGVLDDETYLQLLERMWHHGRLPPDTPLGGRIGLHGLGEADPMLHRRLNWTQGCVALTDAQIEALAGHVRVGTLVVIQ